MSCHFDPKRDDYVCDDCGEDGPLCRCGEVEDDERDVCYWCGGDGWEDECREEGCYCLEGHPCGSCGGSGLAKDMTVW